MACAQSKAAGSTYTAEKTSSLNIEPSTKHSNMITNMARHSADGTPPISPKNTKYPEDEDELDAANSAVILHYQQFRSIISDITAKLNGNFSKEHLSSSLNRLQDVADGFGKYFSVHTAPKDWHHLRSDDSVMVTEVFGIPEILELILLEVDHWDLVNMTKVNKGVRAIINASPSLQVRMYMKGADPTKFCTDLHLPDPSGVVSSPDIYETVFSDATRIGFQVGNDAFPTPRYNEVLGVQARFTLFPKYTRLLVIGEAWKRMLICQPPVKQMRAFRVCAKHHVEIQDMDSFLYSGNGVTIGDLYTCAQQMLAVDFICPWQQRFFTWDDPEESCEISRILFEEA